MNGVSRVSSRPSQVRERLIGALIPDALGPSDENPRVPLAVLPALRRLDNLHPAELLVSTSRMDRSGRVHERILLRELGWNPGSRVDMDTMHGMILIAATTEASTPSTTAAPSNSPPPYGACAGSSTALPSCLLRLYPNR